MLFIPLIKAPFEKETIAINITYRPNELFQNLMQVNTKIFSLEILGGIRTVLNWNLVDSTLFQ